MSGKPWSRQDVDALVRLYPDASPQDLEQILGRTRSAIFNKANQQGLVKSRQYLEKQAAEPSRNFLAHSYQPGERPWNAGKKGYNPGGRCVETQFKAGHKGHRTRPIGSERLNRDGYRERKVQATGTRRKDWIGVHVLTWIEHNGPVPDGHLVVVKNGDKNDLSIDNLEAITRAENMNRNSIHRYPEALNQAIRAAAKLSSTIEELKHEKQD